MVKVLSITLLRMSHGPDKLILKFDFPDGGYPFTENATATMNVARGKGQAYCEKNFPGIPVKLTEYK